MYFYFMGTWLSARFTHAACEKAEKWIRNKIRCRNSLPIAFLSCVCWGTKLAARLSTWVTSVSSTGRLNREDQFQGHTRHVARVLERGLHFAGGLGSSPRKFLNLRWRIPQILMIFFNCQRNFGCPIFFCSWRKCQTSCKRHSERRSSMHWTFEYMGTICGGNVVLNDLEEFRRFEADEKYWEVFLDKCPEAKCCEKPWKVRARTNGT